MKVKELISELQKHDSELYVFHTVYPDNKKEKIRVLHTNGISIESVNEHKELKEDESRPDISKFLMLYCVHDERLYDNMFNNPSIVIGDYTDPWGTINES